jgi:predicted MFS family arabinose efflux permease
VAAVAGAKPGETSVSPAYANYVLGVLFAAYVLNFVDRQILAILLESIKRDLELSDTVMGLLTGTVFAIFYSVLGVPIARWADLWVRRSIVAIGLALWSGMTAASGLAQSLAQLAAARIGVGVGEAALSPPAHSLLADYFPPERRATALGIYAMGIHVGILFGLTVGGWLDDTYGWRVAFLAVGLPGVALALVVRLTVREPPRAAHSTAPPVAEVFRFLWRLPSFRHAAFAAALSAFAGYGFANWAPTFLRRVHGLSSTEAGNLGYAIGIGGAVGSLVAGLLADRLGRRDVRFWLWVPACSALGPLPFTLAFLFHGDSSAILWWLLPGVAIAAWYQGPVFATVQTLAPPSMRAVAAGVLLLIINIVGLGLGPPTVGWLNEHVFAERGAEAVRYSLAAVGVVMAAWSCLHYLLAARHLSADLRTNAAAPGP